MDYKYKHFIRIALVLFGLFAIIFYIIAIWLFLTYFNF